MNKFKVLLCCYTMGIAGCNKIGNPSYMNSGGDRKGDKKKEEEASFSVVQSSSNVVVLHGSGKDYNKAFQGTLSSMKRLADTAEQVAISQQESAEHAIKAAADAKIAAETARKAADDAEKNTPELGGGDASTSTGMTRKAEDDIEKGSRLELGPGGDVL